MLVSVDKRQLELLPLIDNSSRVRYRECRSTTHIMCEWRSDVSNREQFACRTGDPKGKNVHRSAWYITNLELGMARRVHFFPDTGHLEYLLPKKPFAHETNFQVVVMNQRENFWIGKGNLRKRGHTTREQEEENWGEIKEEGLDSEFRYSLHSSHLFRALLALTPTHTRPIQPNYISWPSLVPKYFGLGYLGFVLRVQTPAPWFWRNLTRRCPTEDIRPSRRERDVGRGQMLPTRMFLI